MTVAFDSDVLIYAGIPENTLGQRVLRFIKTIEETGVAGVGSVLLLIEVLSKPTRMGSGDEQARLEAILSHIDLRPCDSITATNALTLAVKYGLKAADAVHLATAVSAGADRFLTNNRRDFPKTIEEIDIVYPDDLPDSRPAAETQLDRGRP